MAKSTTHRIPLAFFRFEARGSEETYIERMIQIRSILMDWSNATHAYPDTSGPVVLHKWTQTPENEIQGAIFHTHEDNLPPAYNPVDKELFDLDLKENQGLGYLTCFHYDPGTNVVMIERLRNSISVSKLIGFIFRNFNQIPVFDAHYILKESAIQSLDSISDIRRFEVSLAKITNGEIFKGQGKSVGELIKLGKSSQALRLKMVASVGNSRSKSLKTEWVKETVRDLLNRNAKGEVKSIKLSGDSEDEDQDAIEIDLINARLKDSFDVASSRYVNNQTVDVRLSSLREVYGRHRSYLHKAYRV